ncbi:TPA: fimbrial protein [Salmonella enterica]|nr:fimbrial protein [Salmonella enterica]
MTKTIMAGALTVLLASFGATAADQGQGVVNFKGKVIDAPCGIAPESADQSIDFGQISKSHLSNGGKSIDKDFNIRLVNCDATGLTKGVQVTFSGNTVTGAPTELATSGGTNTAVQIDYGSEEITFGTPTRFQTISGSDQILQFASRVKQASGKAVTEGEFVAIANFNLSYE